MMPSDYILLAMSGGVDSTAAALLLQDKGYNLVGCTFTTRYTPAGSAEKAAQLAASLHIPHHIVDLDEVFHQEVISYFRDEYLHGRTPNPCVVCNRQIKFGILFDIAHRLHCRYIATGHYARIDYNEGGDRPYLLRAADTAKDQTYFLSQISPDSLRHVIFPLGDMTKPEVRNYLEQKGYTELAHHGESQDICFIHDDYRAFLNLPPNPGDYLNADHHVVGRHLGYTNYTIGQRKGLGIALGEPMFVTGIDAEHNQVFLGRHDDLYTHQVSLHNWAFYGNPAEPVMAQIRYRSRATEAQVIFPENPSADLCVQFKDPVWAVTPGQSCVMYQHDRLVGSGIL